MTTAIDDERLMAYVDDELSAEERAEVSALILQDPALRARAEALRGGAELARRALDGTLREPLPDTLLAQVNAELNKEDDNRVVDISQARRSRWGAPTQTFGLAAAACVMLVAGGILGFWLHGSNPYQGGFDPRIANVLTTANSGSVVALATDIGSADVLPLLTYIDSKGRHCRHYIHRESGPEGKRAFDGVACREPSGNWSPIITVKLDSTETNGGYVAASGDKESTVDEFIKQTIDGAPVAGAAESALIRDGWPQKKEN